ncbi:YbjN domain-containing protein [Bradyrhizobium tropiciagri]|uniref:YbjN domain-containing protein n=1 Tax=Bradyrhizobium tropiciagri TaxID=312253 RepID=UPI001BAB27D7|nr:YbjN domain-containing protein [Bradyrhizobium tropiciagri]MBR0869809.1 YbjN domain-containing protein [Bradyrhizobium tropiciagri]
MSETITSLTLEALRDSFQNVGYRVETLTDPVAGTNYLRSATAGLGFEIRPGNQLAGEDQGFLDIMLVAALQVQGELPLDLVNRWNATRRFGRLQLSPPFLAFCLDVSVAGGVAPNYLRAQIEIWDRLVQELIGYLREELPKVAATNNAAAAGAQPALERTVEQGSGATIQ